MATSQRSTHIPASGDGTRPMAEARIDRILTESEAYTRAVTTLMCLDLVEAMDWPEKSAGVGMSEGTFGIQDGGAALLERSLIPDSVQDMPTHMARAFELEHPSNKGHVGAHSSSPFALRMEAELNAATRHSVAVRSYRAAELCARMAIMTEVSEGLLPLTRQIRDELAPMHIRCNPFEHAHTALFAAIVQALDLPDKDLAYRVALGAPVAGDIFTTHTWQESRPLKRPLGLDFDDLPHAQWNAWLDGDIVARATRSAVSREEATAVWGRTIEELDKGLCDGPWTFSDMNRMYGEDSWRALRRFGVVQKGSMRACDDAAENLVNDSSVSRDKMRCEKADFPARQADRFARHIGRGKRGWSLLHGTEDLESAYRKVMTMTPGYSVVAAWDPASGKTRYFTLGGYNFGSIAAVIMFNAIPAVSASAARRLLGVVTSNFYDDFDVVDLDTAGTAAQDALGGFHRLIGFPFSRKKRVEARPTNVFCGVVTCFKRLAHEGIVEVFVSDERKASIALMVDGALDLGLTPGSAASLAGKLGFTLTWTFGRYGRAALQPIMVRAQADDHSHRTISPGLRRALKFFKGSIGALPRREISTDTAPRPPVLVWSDAMYERKADVPARGGFVVVVPAEGAVPAVTYISSHDTPRDVIDKFVPGKKQYIGQLELLYAVAPYTSLPNVFKGRQVIHFIDNTSACAALIKGYSRAIDSGLIVNAFHAFNVGMRADVFFEYVRSKANPADLPSRDAPEELGSLLVNVGAAHNVVDVKCRLPTIDSWEAPTSDVIDTALRATRPGGKQGKRQRVNTGAFAISD